MKKHDERCGACKLLGQTLTQTAIRCDGDPNSVAAETIV